MRYRKLDSDGDMRYGNGLADFWQDVPDAVAQAVQTRLLLIAGEWYLDQSEGTPYQGGVLGKGADLTADAVIRDRILNTEGVTEIVDGTYSSTLNRDTRQLSVSCMINTIYGTAVVAI